jgi:carbon starvation protein CstA
MPVPFIAILWTFLVTVLWLIIGFRAMRAHEDLAESMNEIRQTIRELVEKQSSKRDE